MKLSEIQDMWTKDAKVNELDLGKSSIQIAELHAKYLNILTNTKLQLRKCEADYLCLRRSKFKYYRGEMTREELEELGWNQFQGLKPLKNEVEDRLKIIIHMARYENAPMKYIFIFYRPDKDWKLHQFKYNDNIVAELEEVTNTYPYFDLIKDKDK